MCAPFLGAAPHCAGASSALPLIVLVKLRTAAKLAVDSWDWGHWNRSTQQKAEFVDRWELFLIRSL
ncbi:MAG: hypothetical protein ABI895_31820 [Deltaproteobacteria bacterium]